MEYYRNIFLFFIIFKRLVNFEGFIYFIFRQRGREGEREGEKPQCVAASCAVPPTGDLACNPGMCPDWELTHNPLVRRLALNPLSYPSQGCKPTFVAPCI